MRKALNATRLIGLLALLAGFMAFGASAAQAEGTWLKGGVAIAGKTPIQAEIDKEVVLLTKVGLAKIEILCTKVKLVGANLEVGGLGSGKAHFEECITKINTVTNLKCIPHSHGHANGLIETNALHGSLRLHTGGLELYEVLATAGSIADLVFGTGECPIGNLIQITGKIFLKDTQGELLVDRTQHLFEEGPLSALLFGANPATIDGSAFGFLAAPNVGQTFAGHV